MAWLGSLAQCLTKAEETELRRNNIPRGISCTDKRKGPPNPYPTRVNAPDVM